MEKFEHEYKADQIQVLEGLEAVIIYIATNIYAIGLAGLSGTVGSTGAISTIVAMLFLNGMYLAIVQYGGQFAEKLVGGH